MQYKSAKKQLNWAMQVLEEEIKSTDEMCDTYASLMDNARTESDQQAWFKSYHKEHTKLRTLKSLHFMITHPDIYDEHWK